MKTLQTVKLTLTGVAALLTALPLSADDTEIYFNQAAANSTVKPNVLFIMDTSGSMQDEVVTSIPSYKPATTYGSSSNDYFYMYTLDYEFITRIHRNQADCPTLEALMDNSATTPEVQSRAAYKPKKNWNQVCDPTDCKFTDGASGDTVRCQTDYNGNQINWNQNSGKTYRKRVFVPSNYHDYLQSVAQEPATKTDIMKQAALNIVDSVTDINMGMMRFNGGSGGYAVKDFLDMSDSTNKQSMRNAINALPASGSTPLAETMYEAYRWFSGRSPKWGTNPYQYNSDADSSVVSGGNYKSPISDQCQANYIVYLTDGEPTSDSGSDSSIRGLSGVGYCPASGSSSGTAGSTCLDEMAGFMFENDMDRTDTYEGKQNVITYTIGFDIDLELLQATANAGGGQYYTAKGALALKSAFNNIISQIAETEDTFVAPAVTVNAFNNLQHRDELYYALFKPSESPRWVGNLKRYRIDGDGNIKDLDDKNAVDDGTGYFISSAKSWWLNGTEPDGDVVALGGTSSEMKASANRKMYTYLGTDKQLSASVNRFPLDTAAGDNASVTNTMLGVADATERSEVIAWARGEDIEGVNNDPNDTIHNYMSDVIHTQPVVVTYGGTQDNPDDTVFYSDNMGFLYAIDTDDGSEIFSFIPEALLGNPKQYYDNDINQTTKIYGMDGSLTVWRNESGDDTDATIEAGEGDHVYLYANMRRGGKNYYALDVTNRSNPKILWTIEGGVPGTDYEDMGQSWSPPRLGKIRWNCDSATSAAGCEDRTVMFFSGGYDELHDVWLVPTGTTLLPDEGNSLYMVDAETGELLWSAGGTKVSRKHKLEITEMVNSIPSAPSIGDIDNDGYIDLVFLTDITGQVFRFDIANYTKTGEAASFATGGMVADLGDVDNNSANDDDNFRRFYNSPDIALYSTRGSSSFMTIALTSGYRARPKSSTVTAPNRLYVLFDKNVFYPPTENGTVSYTAIDETDLFNATTTPANRSSNAPYGYYKNFTATGEKGLARSVTFAGSLLFTTYLPDSGAACSGTTGGGRLYLVDVLTGETRLTDDGGTPEDTSDDGPQSFINLAHGGIPPEASIIYTSSEKTVDDGEGNETTLNENKTVVCVGTECFGDLLDGGDPIVKTYWREN